LHSAPEVGAFPLWDSGPRDGKRVGLGLALDGESFYVPFGHREGEPRLEAGSMVEEVLASLPGSDLSGHDVKENELALRQFEDRPLQWAFSTSLAAYLLGAGARDPRLEDLARDFLSLDLMPVDQLLGTGRNARLASANPVEDQARFAAGRARAVFELRPRLSAEMRNL